MYGRLSYHSRTEFHRIASLPDPSEESAEAFGRGSLGSIKPVPHLSSLFRSRLQPFHPFLAGIRERTVRQYQGTFGVGPRDGRGWGWRPCLVLAEATGPGRGGSLEFPESSISSSYGVHRPDEVGPILQTDIPLCKIIHSNAL